jgi:hypothetical protein
MPAKKPADLIESHETKVDRRRREYRQTSMTPTKALSVYAPKQLIGEEARKTWQETVTLYLTLDARIVSVLDRGLLIDFCNVSEQLVQIDGLRARAMKNGMEIQATLEKMQNKSSAEIDIKALTRLVDSVIGALDMILKLDARADRKRDLLHKFRQSLMLTPRSRGGVSPDEKPKEKPQSEMAKIIDGEVKKDKRKRNV